MGSWGERGETQTLGGMFGGSQAERRKRRVSFPRSSLERGKETSRNEPRVFFITSLIFSKYKLCVCVCTYFLRVCIVPNHGKPVVSGQFNDAVKCGLWLTFSVLMPAGNWGFNFFFLCEKTRQRLLLILGLRSSWCLFFVYLRSFFSGTLTAFARCRKEAVSLPWFIKQLYPHKHLFCYLLPTLPEWNWDLLKFKEIRCKLTNYCRNLVQCCWKKWIKH